jgi:type II secretory pathway pseudopilin PulG
MRLLHEESGFTLIELLVSCAIMILVLGATLGALDTFGSTTTRDQKLLQAQDQARIALDRAARELRNGSAYATDASQPAAIVRSGPWDLIVQTVDPQAPPGGSLNTLNLMRVRYCLNTTTSTFYRQAQKWTTATAPSLISDPACPAAGWTSQTVVATNVVNGGSRRVFTYNSGNAGDVNEAPPAAPDIASVRIGLWVDLDQTRPPAATQLVTGVFLRNKNRRPVATCSAAPTGNGHVSLNGSRSTDPEGGLLTFTWADGATPIAAAGSLVDYASPTTGVHTFTVTATDPGGLTSQATCQVTVL